MDLGLFNKVPMAMGDHGTLIGNWVEERALRDATGFERHVPFTGAASAASLSDMRIVTHSDNMDDDSKKHMKQSIAKTSFQRPDARAYKQEIYRKSSCNFQNTTTADRSSQPKTKSQVQLGTYKNTYTTTYRDATLTAGPLNTKNWGSIRLPQTTITYKPVNANNNVNDWKSAGAPQVDNSVVTGEVHSFRVR